MHENLPLGASPPAAKNNETSFLTQEVDICDGEVKLVRTKQSNQIWQVRIWVRGEGRYFRKSLRTRDLEKAQEKAKSIYYQMMGQVEIGKKIFSISALELVDGYKVHQQQRVTMKGRWLTNLPKKSERKSEILADELRFDVYLKNIAEKRLGA
jgi:hypothetical protein